MIIRRYKIFLFVLTVMINYSFNVLAIEVEKRNFQVEVAVVDVQLILEHSNAIQDIKKSISQITNDIQEYVTSKQTEFKKIEAELVKKQTTVGALMFQTEVDSFNNKVNKTQKLIQEKKSRLEQAHSKAVAKVNEVTIEIIKELARKYKFNIALPSSQVLFADVELNITSEVITLLNNKLTTVKIEY
ncbi:MAG: OmpH family outer membrane protein [Rickettsiaceae bacterium]|nr:MAG: OmpH family outer membrane protein [Rickettsiaceae bacterium]